MNSAAGRAPLRLPLIDNYDSFTYNLMQAFLVLGADMRVHRNDEITADEARALEPTHLCVSPGPGVPSGAGVSIAMILEFSGSGVFAGLPKPFEAGRYHSLIARRDRIPEESEVSAWTAEGEVMGVRHKSLVVEGVQFHPESILTPDGLQLLATFLQY